MTCVVMSAWALWGWQRGGTVRCVSWDFLALISFLVLVLYFFSRVFVIFISEKRKDRVS